MQEVWKGEWRENSDFSRDRKFVRFERGGR